MTDSIIKSARGADDEGLRVFLSYSRSDEFEMRRIAGALRANGFEPNFDQASYDPDQIATGISAEDEWWLRIQEMIGECDVMLFLVSPESAASSVCDEEIAYARALGKRIIAVKIREIDFTEAPPRLAALNVSIDFTAVGPGFDSAMSSTIRALKTDVAWHRDGRRLFDRISEWDRKNRPQGLLLREGALADAEAWSARRPSSVGPPGELYFAYTEASRNQISKDMRRRRLWRRLTTFAAISALIFASWGFAISFDGQRNVERTYSQLLTSASRDALQNSQTQLATRLSVLSASDTVFSPASKGAQFQLAHASLLHGEFSELRAFEAGARYAEFSPTNDALLVFSSRQSDTNAQIWTIEESGAWSALELVGHRQQVTAANFSDTGQFLATGSADCSVRIWERTSEGGWQSVSELSDPEAISKGRIAGSDCGPLLSPEDSGGLFGALGAETRDVFNEVASQLSDNREATSEYVRNASGHIGTITSVRFSSDANRILSASTDGSVRIWERNENNEWSSSTVLALDAPVNAHFSPDEQSVLIRKVYSSEYFVARQNKNEHWWSERIAVPNVEISSTSFFETDDQMIATASNGTAPLYIQRTNNGWSHREATIADTEWIGPLFKRQTELGWAESMALSNDGRSALILSSGNEAHLWTRGESDVWMSIRLFVRGATVRSAVFSQDSRKLAVATSAQVIHIYDIDELGAVRWSKLTGQSGAINSVTFSADGQMLASASSDGSVRVWNMKEETTFAATKVNPEIGVTLLRDADRNIDNLEQKRVSNAVFSKQSSVIYTMRMFGDRTNRWQLGDDNEWSIIPAPDILEPVYPVQVSFDQKYRIILTNGNAVIVPNISDNLISPITLARGEFAFTSASFSPSQALAVTTTADGLLYVWAPNQDDTWSGIELAHLGYPIRSASFSPDGSQILGVTALGELLLWDIAILTNLQFPEFDRRDFEASGRVDLMEFACDRMSRSKIWYPSGVASTQAKLSESDFGAVPILRTLGLEPGIDVCARNSERTIDHLISRSIPRNWWSGP